MSEALLPRVDGTRRFGAEESRTNPSGRLEDMLAREKAERDADADKMGELLGRATRAEAERQTLLERLVDTEARLRDLEREKALLESQLGGGKKPKEGRRDSVPTLATARSMATELARVLEKIATPNGRPTPADFPAPKSSSRG